MQPTTPQPPQPQTSQCKSLRHPSIESNLNQTSREPLIWAGGDSPRLLTLIPRINIQNERHPQTLLIIHVHHPVLERREHQMDAIRIVRRRHRILDWQYSQPPSGQNPVHSFSQRAIRRSSIADLCLAISLYLPDLADLGAGFVTALSARSQILFVMDRHVSPNVTEHQRNTLRGLGAVLLPLIPWGSPPTLTRKTKDSKLAIRCTPFDSLHECVCVENMIKQHNS